MTLRRGSLARGTTLAIVADSVSALLTIITTPYLVRHLGLQPYGILGIVGVFVSQLAWLSSGLSSAVVRSVAEALGLNRRAELRRILDTALLLGVVTALVTALLFVALFAQYARYLAASQPAVALPSLWWIAAAGAIMGASQSFGNPIQGFLLGQERFGVLALLRFSQASGRLLAAVAAAPLGLAAVLTAQATSDVLVLGVGLLWTVPTGPRYTRGGFNRQYMSQLSHLGLQFAATSFIVGLLVDAEKIALALARPVGDFAFYAVPHNAAVRIAGIANAFAAILIPRLASLGAAGEDAEIAALTRRSTQMVLGLVGAAACVGITIMPELLGLWLGQAFAAESTRIARLLLVVVVVSTAGSAYNALLRARAQPLMLGGIYAVQIPVYAILLFLSLSVLGVWGAAMALLIRVCIDFALHRVAARRILGIRLPDASSFAVILTCSGLVLVTEALGARLVSIRLLLGGATAVMLVRGLMTRSDWATLGRVIGLKGEGPNRSNH